MCPAQLVVALREFKPIVWRSLTKEQQHWLLDYVKENGADKDTLKKAYRRVRENRS